VVRARREKPGAGYLLAGLAAMGAMTYSAYLGGKMVYEHGIGVRAAGGLDEARSREILPGTLRDAARESGSLAAQGARRAAGDLRSGHIAPALRP
ncbi:MAG TPA: hypothetical protein VHG88_17310, partial [Burkholderiales bacterium]|nr:hypothetical protein [Burkholderiales bacterium]